MRERHVLPNACTDAVLAARCEYEVLGFQYVSVSCGLATGNLAWAIMGRKPFLPLILFVVLLLLVLVALPKSTSTTSTT